MHLKVGCFLWFAPMHFNWPVKKLYSKSLDAPSQKMFALRKFYYHRCAFLWPNYKCHESSILGKGYGIKYGAIGNNLRNTLGMPKIPVLQIQNTRTLVYLLPPRIGCREFMCLIVFVTQFCLILIPSPWRWIVCMLL